jgi:hypothetical protein
VANTQLHQLGSTTIEWTASGNKANQKMNLYVAEKKFTDWLTGSASSVWKTLFDSDFDDSGADEWIHLASNIDVSAKKFGWTVGTDIPDGTDYEVIARLANFPSVYSAG